MRRPALSASLLTLVLSLPAAGEEAPKPQQVDMAEMMQKARKFTQPGESHTLLKRFLGSWDTELRLAAPHGEAPPDKGVATFSWLIDGRWLKMESRGTMFGMPSETFTILGYDNFKMSYVTAAVRSLDTALLHSEGDLTPDGKSLVAYGTLDEYLTGEHDKMVKYAWRFLSDDEMTLEIHDLPIGEVNTKVVEIRFKRRK